VLSFLPVDNYANVLKKEALPVDNYGNVLKKEAM
jgi:hypothetical protein